MEEAVTFRNPEEYGIGEIILSDEQINQRIAELAQDIATTHNGKQLLVVGLLKGGFRVTSDLVTQLHDKGLTDVEITFLKTKSYLDKTEAQQEPEITQDMDINPEGRHILLVDDIADTGKSLKMVEENLSARGAESIASFVLLDKPSRREVDFVPTYIGFTIPNIWVQGRGMDTNEKGRADRHIRRGPYFI
jgi:hypoxanthine phosphoribosyltransferase